MSSSYFFEGLALERKRTAIGDGLEAAIYLYYENHTDAHELDPQFIRALEYLTDETISSIDVEDLVTETEAKINESGGIRSEETSRRHYVRTYQSTCPDCDTEVSWPGQHCRRCK